MDVLQVELAGQISATVLDRAPVEESVDIGVASGLAGERIVKLLAESGPAAVAAIKRVVQALVRAERIEGVKITRNGVEIGSMRTSDAPKVLEFVNEVLDRLGPPAGPGAGSPPAQ